jgi:hypothetical protein
LEKNKDFVVPEQVQMLEKSTLLFVKLLLPKQQQAAGTRSEGGRRKEEGERGRIARGICHSSSCFPNSRLLVSKGVTAKRERVFPLQIFHQC